MYYVYILKLNKKDSTKNFYIGYSNDLRRRMIQHKNNEVFSTKDKNSELIYYESYSSKELAQQREKSLKQFGSAYSGLLKRIGEK